MIEDKIWYTKLDMISGEIIGEDNEKIILKRRDGVVKIYKKDINRVESKDGEVRARI